MKLHPRAQIMSRARMALTAHLGIWHDNHDDALTDAEMLAILSGALGDEIGAVTKYMIRAERHPEDASKPGGVE